MKKIILSFLTAAVTGMTVVAADQVSTIPEFYSFKISADGKVIVSLIDEVVAAYNTETKTITRFEDAFILGNGNCITNDGRIIVGGTSSDSPVMMVDGKAADLSALSKYGNATFNAITGSGTRIIGEIANPSGSKEGTMYLPVYFDVDSEGKLSSAKKLPYPALDWTGRQVQYCSALWISDDGNTIMGTVIDYSGQCTYPIVYSYKEGDGWSYSFPTESLINPNKLKFPEWPGEFEEISPVVTDFMTASEKEAYNAALEEYYDSGYNADLYPEAADYMTTEQIAAYNEAVDVYNGKVEAYNEKIRAFFIPFEEAVNASTFFMMSENTMNAGGTKLGLSAVKIVEDDDPNAWEPFKVIYPAVMVDLPTGEIKEIKMLDGDLSPNPRQILPDGTMIGNTFASTLPPQGFVLAPGADEFVPIEQYLESLIPTAATWMNDNLKYEVIVDYEYDEYDEEIPVVEEVMLTGYVVVSDNWSIITGGEHAYIYSDNATYESYVLCNDVSGVEDVEAETGVAERRYYDLNGFEVKNPSDGIFIEQSIGKDGKVTVLKKKL